MTECYIATKINSSKQLIWENFAIYLKVKKKQISKQQLQSQSDFVCKRTTNSIFSFLCVQITHIAKMFNNTCILPIYFKNNISLASKTDNNLLHLHGTLCIS